MLIADDDVDSVQHLDLSVIGDNLHDENSKTALIERVRADTERKQI